MATNTYKAQLNYHDSRWGWGNEGTASQGAWDGTGTRTGVLYFPGLASLKNKIINSVKITVTTGQTGWGLATTKTVNFYRSAAQGGIKTSLNANHKTGSAIGSVQGAMYNNTVTYTAAFLAARIAAGDDTYCIYNGSSSTDYLKWTSVSLEVNWSEPATQPSLSKSTVEMGTAVTISTPAANSGYRHTLRYAFGSASGTIASGVASAQSWTPPVSLAAQIPSATSGSGAIYCDTYSGSTLLGTKSVSITLTVPASVRPTAGTLSAAVADDSSGTGMYVKGMGKARVTLSGAAGAQGSSIRSTVISGGGWSASGTTLLTGVLTAAGTVTFTATVTDSRGRTASTTTSISVIDYARPGISSCTVYRCNSAGARQNDGTYAAVEIKAFYSAISGNTLSLGVAYKRSSESGYGGSTTLTNNGKTIIGGGGLSASTTYDVRVTVSDKYNTVEQVYSLPTKSVLLSFLKNLGAAIGKVAELSGWLDIGLNTRIREDLQVDGNVTLKSLTSPLPISSGGTKAKNVSEARGNLGTLAQIEVRSDSNFPFSWGTLACRGSLGNTIGQNGKSDNYYWGVDSNGCLWGGAQINGAVAPVWKRAMMMDSEQRFRVLWSGSLYNGNGATVTDGGKYAALLIGAVINGKNFNIYSVPAGSIGVHFSEGDYYMDVELELNTPDLNLFVRGANNSGGRITYVWGILKYLA